MAPDFTFEPFQTKALLTLPTLDLAAAEIWDGFQFETESSSTLLKLADVEKVPLYSLRPSVLHLSLSDVSLPEDLEQSVQISAATSDDEANNDVPASHGDDGDQLWALTDVQKLRQENKLVSWDHFIHEEHEERQAIYLSEAGPAAFDALSRKVRSTKSSTEDVRYAKHDVLLNALFDLGLGQTSAFFEWNKNTQTMQKAVDNYTVSGLSQGALDEVIAQLLEIGSQSRRLQQLGKTHTQDNATKVALVGAITSSLDAVREHIEAHRIETGSLIKLRELYRFPGMLIKQLDHLRKPLSDTRNDDRFVSLVFALLEQSSLEEPLLEQSFNEIAARLIEPGVQNLNHGIGLSQSGVMIATQTPNELYGVLPEPIDVMMTSTMESMRLLRENNFRESVLLSSPSQTRYHVQFSWEGVIELQERANAYEQSAKDASLRCGRSTSCIRNKDSTDLDKATGVSMLEADDPFVPRFEIVQNGGIDLPELNTVKGGSLRTTLLSALSTKSTPPTFMVISCRQALELSITPFLTAQHRLLSFSVLRLLFRDYSLIAHLRLLNQFQLMSDGIFASRLATALFDSDQTSGEGSRRSNTSTGLRLQGRETWPPASSELRLVLMGILSESMTDKEDTSLTESVSFAIRDLSDEALDRCKDVNSIHALDFLRLHHKLPNTLLDSVITAKSLSQYDQIFRHLLRVHRMKSLAQSLVWEVCKCQRQRPIGNTRSATRSSFQDHKFRLEIQHFVFALADYSQNVAIGSLWTKFEAKVQEVSDAIQRNDYNSTLSLAGNLDHVRQMHDNVLDDITSALLLPTQTNTTHQEREKGKSMRMIENLFGKVLEFAAVVRNPHHSDVPGSATSDDIDKDTTTSRLYVDFRRQVSSLIEQLTTMTSSSSRASNGSGGEDSHSDLLEQLPLRLDFNRHYTTSKSKIYGSNAKT